MSELTSHPAHRRRELWTKFLASLGRASMTTPRYLPFPRLRGRCSPSRSKIWTLSKAAIADAAFIETHDPHGSHQAMGRALFEVVPGCLSDQCIAVLAKRTPIFDPTSPSYSRY